MRKYVKDELESQLTTLRQAVHVLEKIYVSDHEQALELLTQMQEMMIGVGSWAERFLGESHYFIQCMEEACEAVYQISCQLSDAAQARFTLVQMERSLDEVSERIRGERETKEILFMPYQVSMWDSLESVYLAAKDDEELDCIVMPIPYYDVLPDGALGELHYQGDQYPAEIPITYYEEYSIEEHCPDMIFFHNPYDGNNMVTRVPEKYYASYIKDYTNELVYIPYMVSSQYGPARHQGYMPGVLFSDHVITQVGQSHDNYKTYYTEALKEAGLEQSFAPAEEKFLQLGSPKFDKLFTFQADVEQLPQAWQHIIKKKDGSRKKIILYNLSIEALLEQSEAVLDKLDSVFELFKQLREEVVLWLRPHPLLLSTIEAMRPQLKAAYLNRMDAFRREGWGIYDDTPDPTLAMVIADAYYGDFSSLIISLQQLDCIMLVQDMAVRDLSPDRIHDAACYGVYENMGREYISETTEYRIEGLIGFLLHCENPKGVRTHESNGYRIYKRLIKGEPV